MFSFFAYLLFGLKREDGTVMFKKSIADFFDVDQKRIFLFGAARMGLYSILKAIDHNEDDEVLVAGYTCVVVTNAVKNAGFKAKYVDIVENNLNIDTKGLLDSIDERTKAIVVTHNFGITFEDIGLIRKKKPEIVIIEDAAHTMGSVDKNGIKAGLIGDAAFFSLEYSKPITTGMGGIILINDTGLCEKIRDYYNTIDHYPASINLKIFLTLITHLFTSFRYTAVFKGLKFRMLKLLGLLYVSSKAEIQGEMPEHYPVKLSKSLAFLGSQQMKEIQKINQIKAEIVREYFNIFKGLKNIRQYYNENYNYVRYPIVFGSEVDLDKIRKIKKELARSGVFTGEWFNDVVHPKGSYRYCYDTGLCPVGESISLRMLNLPVNINNRISSTRLKEVREILLRNPD